jgi:acyl-CoA thioester hydrolase
MRRPVWYQAGRVAPVYTGHVAVRHDELDRFGRVQPATYLRYMAHMAVEASAAAGFDTTWYAGTGTHWLVRRSRFTLASPAVGGERLAVETWVEDFRRVRSYRAYRISGADGRRCLAARTDWVYVDRLHGRPRRIPPEMEAAFGRRADSGEERPPWTAPAPPAAPARTAHRVRHAEVDTVGHVNNAAWLDILTQAVLDVLEGAGWPLERMLGAGGVPLVGGADLEYLTGARYGDRLAVETWFTPAPGALDAHQQVRPEDGGRPLVQATTRWRWGDVAGAGVQDGLLAGLLPALGPLLAA